MIYLASNDLSNTLRGPYDLDEVNIAGSRLIEVPDYLSGFAPSLNDGLTLENEKRLAILAHFPTLTNYVTNEFESTVPAYLLSSKYSTGPRKRAMLGPGGFVHIGGPFAMPVAPTSILFRFFGHKVFYDTTAFSSSYRADLTPLVLNTDYSFELYDPTGATLYLTVNNLEQEISPVPWATPPAPATFIVKFTNLSADPILLSCFYVLWGV